MLTDRLRRKSTRKIRNIKMKAWYSILGTEILSYEEFHCKLNKLRKSQRKAYYICQNENSLDSLVSNQYE